MKDLKVYKTNDGNYKAYVKQFKPLGKWNGKYSVSFEAFGMMDNDYRGTSGVGVKVYDTFDKAVRAAKRYVNKFDK